MKTNQSSTLFGASPYVLDSATIPQLRYIQGLLAQAYKVNVSDEDWRIVQSIQYQFNMHNEGRQDMTKRSAASYINMLKAIIDKGKQKKASP